MRTLETRTLGVRCLHFGGVGGGVDRGAEGMTKCTVHRKGLCLQYAYLMHEIAALCMHR